MVYLSFYPLDNMSKETKSKSNSLGNEKLLKEMLKPVTKSDSELEDELKDLEVENSAGGKDGGAG
jgi:hypothetical protein